MKKESRRSFLKKFSLLTLFSSSSFYFGCKEKNNNNGARSSKSIYRSDEYSFEQAYPSDFEVQNFIEETFFFNNVSQSSQEYFYTIAIDKKDDYEEGKDDVLLVKEMILSNTQVKDYLIQGDGQWFCRNISYNNNYYNLMFPLNKVYKSFPNLNPVFYLTKEQIFFLNGFRLL